MTDYNRNIVQAATGYYSTITTTTLHQAELAYTLDTKQLVIGFDGLGTNTIINVDDSFHKYLLASRYHVFPSYNTTTLNVTALADNISAFPWPNSNRIVVTKIVFKVTIGTIIPGAKGRLGIYKDNGSIYPGTLILDAGEVAIDSVGVKEITSISSILLPNTLYWLVILPDEEIEISGFNLTYGSWGGLGSASSDPTTSLGNSYYVAQAYGALPSTFPIGGTVSTQLGRIGVYF